MTAGRGRQPPRLVPGAHDARRARHADARQPHGRLPVHEADGLDHGRRHGRRGRRGQPRGGRPARRPRRAAGVPAGLPLRAPTRLRRRARRAVALAGHARRVPARAREAGVGIDDVAHLDLYSCFASSVHFALDALGIDPLADGRPLTVTGGLPYAGGAASNYLTHSLAAMVDVLRRRPGLARPRDRRRHAHDQARRRACTRPSPARPSCGPIADAARRARPADRRHHDGPATVAAYSVVHGRDGGPSGGCSSSTCRAAGPTPGSRSRRPRRARGRGVGRPHGHPGHRRRPEPGQPLTRLRGGA